MNSWRDFAIDITGLDWQRLLSRWSWLLGQRHFEPIAMSSFGDWFMLDADGNVHFLDIVGGELRKIAGSRTDYEAQASAPENIEPMLHFVYQTICAQTHDHLRKLPPGTHIKGFKVKWE